MNTRAISIATAAALLVASQVAPAGSSTQVQNLKKELDEQQQRIDLLELRITSLEKTREKQDALGPVQDAPDGGAAALTFP